VLTLFATKLLPNLNTGGYLPTERRIISVDGEETKANGHSSYWLLAAGDDKGFRDSIEHDGSVREESGDVAKRSPDSRVANYGLPTVRCLEFLLSLPKAASDLIIGFSINYDISKILQDLPFKNQWEYAREHKTEWNGYVIQGIPKKWFKISTRDRSVKIWDVFSYWQCSFAKALDANKDLFVNVPGSKEHIDFIVRMKALRAEDFPDMSPDEISEYCFNECTYLSIMYRDILVNCKALGLTPNAHSGPGALAEAFFNSQSVRSHSSYGDMWSECGMPREVAMRAYYGGRFEVSEIGNIGDVFQYDIHSAYPAVAVDLPCLSCGSFSKVSKYVPGNRWGFYLVGSNTSGSWGPFPFRTGGERLDTNGRPIARDDKGRQTEGGTRLFNEAMKGSIAFPHGGLRWVTADEVEVALKHFPAEQIPIYSGWIYKTNCLHRPFAALEELYLRRKHPEKKHEVSKGMGMVIKLIINSVYGKTAQSIGGRDGEAPAFQCYPWAAWMTGGTRAKVLDAALIGGSNVVAIATDGILSRVELDDSLPVSEWELGKWEKKEKKDCWIGKPGIYAFGRELSSEFKKRGLDARYFPASLLREQWDNGEWLVYPEDTPVGFMPIQLAILRKDWGKTYGQWIEFPKKNSFYTNCHKRDFPEEIDIMLPHEGTVIELETFTIPANAQSMPYVPKSDWADAYSAGMAGDMDIAILELDDIVDMDGMISDPEWVTNAEV
jgi:hypothetical protein